ncbi:hypothetical protein L6164_013312 [Bauhinia variegata]|uniref:Uncharacterized protein n=1 Tax=Bauhinia variegata TaxID=167791 RepID=A0ACB9PBP0_BAUVA|nr:hypothetical protein L6164_013312 [Bauhinia variegata]
MIVEDEQHTYNCHFNYSYDHSNNDEVAIEVSHGLPPNLLVDFQRYLGNRANVRQRQTDQQLQADLVEHI